MKKPEWIKRLFRREENPDEMQELFPEEGNGILAIILSLIASFFIAVAFITIILVAEWIATGY